MPLDMSRPGDFVINTTAIEGYLDVTVTYKAIIVTYTFVL